MFPRKHDHLLTGLAQKKGEVVDWTADDEQPSDVNPARLKTLVRHFAIQRGLFDKSDDDLFNVPAVRGPLATIDETLQDHEDDVLLEKPLIRAHPSSADAAQSHSTRSIEHNLNPIRMDPPTVSATARRSGLHVVTQSSAAKTRVRSEKMTSNESAIGYHWHCYLICLEYIFMLSC